MSTFGISNVRLFDLTEFIVWYIKGLRQRYRDKKICGKKSVPFYLFPGELINVHFKNVLYKSLNIKKTTLHVLSTKKSVFLLNLLLFLCGMDEGGKGGVQFVVKNEKLKEVKSLVHTNMVTSDTSEVSLWGVWGARTSL